MLTNKARVIRSLRCLHASPWIGSTYRLPPALPDNVKTILKDKSGKPLDNPQITTLMNFFMNREITFNERNYLIKYLYGKGAHENILTVGERCLFDPNGKFIEKVSVDELKRYVNSLVMARKTISLEQVAYKLIAQFSITRKEVVIQVINSMLVNLFKVETVPEALLKWVKITKRLHGHCDFTNYEQYRYILKTLIFCLREIDFSDPSYAVLELVKEDQGALTASQFASTLIYLFSHNRGFGLVEQLWNYKVENQLPISSTDLTSICKAYCHFKKYDLVEQVHSKYPEAHDDHSQFDYVLIAYAKQQNWQNLQDQFNALFGIGELPSINHYGIVMYAIAELGESEMVEKLYGQLLRRGMIPTLPVLQSLLHVYYKSGDLNGCFKHFELFRKYDIRPTPSSYVTMLKVYRNMGNIDGALKMLKQMTDNKVEMWETHFSIIINLCAKTTNYAVAQELFQIMKEHYNIKPSGSSIASLMYVYTESDLPQQSLKLFSEYCGNGKKTKIRENEISIYNKAIEAYIKMGQKDMCELLFQDILKRNLETNSEFYEVMIKYLTTTVRDFETAENVLDQLLDHPKLKASSSHFECLMGAYDRISHRDGVFKLYQKMLDRGVQVNSKILYYLIKATFKTKLRTRANLEEAIHLVEDIMKRASDRSLDITFSSLHPSVVAWPMRVISKFHSPMRAMDLLNKYNELFYGKGDPANSRLVIMRSLMVLYAETEQWDDFERTFEKYLSKIEYYQNLPSSTVKNKKLLTLFKGVFGYKIKHLVATNNVLSIPKWLNELHGRGFVLDNDSWNEAILTMFSDSRTIEQGLGIVDQRLIHGYNLIHKYRLLRKNTTNNTSTDRGSWFLERKAQDPKTFQPSLYLKSDVAEKIKESMDNYLSTFGDVGQELERLIRDYKYFMKSYLMKPRVGIPNWDGIEAKHAYYFRQLRESKRVVPPEKFKN